jgi:hypothetical protein
MLNKIYRVLIAFICTVVVLSCEQDTFAGLEIEHSGNISQKQEIKRDYNQEERNVLLLYSAGFNSISRFLTDDINDLVAGNLPSLDRMEDVLLVYSHHLAPNGGYNVPESPVLMRIYKDMADRPVMDTLVVYPSSVHSATASQLNDVLMYVKENYPARSYGMIFSSHATGYLPSGYYTNPANYVYTPSGGQRSFGQDLAFKESQGVPYVEPEYDPIFPMVKSVGQDQIGTYGNYTSYEIQIEDFARALPMYMDYILFDACLMGGVEVAYELAGNCGKVGFSQTEVLAEGFDYKTLTSHLLYGGIPDPVAVCKDYYHQYDVQSGVYRSATISMVDCSKMEPLAEVCARLFEKYREAISRLKPSVVQRYYRSDYHWFYDLVDIIAEAGADAGELEELNYAVAECMIYKAATPEFMDSFIIKDYSGFSMYLPSDGSRELDKYYRTLKWNIATGLVE